MWATGTQLVFDISGDENLFHFKWSLEIEILLICFGVYPFLPEVLVGGSRSSIWCQTHLGTDLSSKGHNPFSLWGNNIICWPPVSQSVLHTESHREAEGTDWNALSNIPESSLKQGLCYTLVGRGQELCGEEGDVVLALSWFLKVTSKRTVTESLPSLHCVSRWLLQEQAQIA
jgi:hypothetical protein